MLSSKYPKFRHIFFLLGLICFPLLIILPPSPAGAMLPPRYTPTPIPDDHDQDHPIGAYIELQVEAAPVGLWTVVQWQDSSGTWQEVEGWRGSLDPDGCKTWWVSANHFGQGPFRWVVYQGQNGSFLATTDPFHLPGQAGETKTILLSLGSVDIRAGGAVAGQ